MTGKILLIFISFFIQAGLLKTDSSFSDNKNITSGYLKISKAKTNKNKPKITEDSKACKPPKENLIVVNFTTAKLTLYVNTKKAGTVKPLDQISFKYVLPVGKVSVELLNAAKESVYTGEYEILSQGKQSCKITKSIILR